MYKFCFIIGNFHICTIIYYQTFAKEMRASSKLLEVYQINILKDWVGIKKFRFIATVYMIFFTSLVVFKSQIVLKSQLQKSLQKLK